MCNITRFSQIDNSQQHGNASNNTTTPSSEDSATRIPGLS